MNTRKRRANLLRCLRQIHPVKLVLNFCLDYPGTTRANHRESISSKVVITLYGCVVALHV